MAPVRSHTKSRLGCRTCRSRKVKCDETGYPTCNNCAKRNTKCDWPVELTRVEGSHSSNEPASAVQQHSRILPSPEQPLTPHNFDMVTLELFHHCCTGMTLSHDHIGDKLAELKHTYQHTLPRLALSYPFLMHSILSVSALNLHKTYKGTVMQLDHHTLSEYHYRQAIPHTATLCKDGQCISTDHSCTQLATAQFVSGNLLSFVAFSEASTRMFGKQAGFQVDAIVDWMQSQRGRIPHFFEDHKQKLFNGPISGTLRFSTDIISEIFGNHYVPPTPAGNIPMFPTLLYSIHVAFLDSADESELSEPSVAETYRNAVTVLERIHGLFVRRLPTHALYTWSVIISPEFLEYVRERRPQSLVIFANFCAFFQASLTGSTSLWWAEGHHDWVKIIRGLLSHEWQTYLDVCLSWGKTTPSDPVSGAIGEQDTAVNWAAQLAGGVL
ncbi:hypothetical protein DL96DRAFT_1819640 [Flagelloscypha sp. PMI_526]|nr:hypothetical protein DL96DRAFT_1819640 [Flagelloscypha sp. PMI_526]